MEKTPLSWSKLGEHFADEDKAREYLEFLRWGNAGPVCPRCGGDNPYRLTPKATSDKPGRKGLLKCRACRKQFTVTVGTVFEDSHISRSQVATVEEQVWWRAGDSNPLRARYQ